MVVKVGVVIAAYNAEKYIKETLLSVLNQTYADFEVVVVDDGSTDKTRLIVEEIMEKNLGKIRYFYQDNAGVSVARNKGLKESKREYIALNDSDDVWKPDLLETLVPVLEKNKDVGLVHADYTRMTESGDMLCKPYRDPKYLSGSIFKHLFLRKAAISGNAVVFRHECLSKAGNYDEYLSFLGCEDRDFWLRIVKHYKVKYIDEQLAYYRMREQSLNHNWDKIINGRLYVINKHCPKGGRNFILRTQALTCVYKEYGDHFLFRKEFSKAKVQYIKAIFYSPFSLWSLINLFKAVIKYEPKDLRDITLEQQ
jgi:glycosyltransferase involved in cell wall biosynthesis